MPPLDITLPPAHQESNRFETAFAVASADAFSIKCNFFSLPYATNIPCTLKNFPPSISMVNVTEHYKYNIVQDLRKNVL